MSAQLSTDSMGFSMNVKILIRFLGKKKYSPKLWKAFNEVFDVMAVAAVVQDKVFCVHGGITEEWQGVV